MVRRELARARVCLSAVVHGARAGARRSPTTTWATGCCPRGAAALGRLLPYTFFTAAGAEAVEVACKLARSVTGRTGLVSAEHGYHGHVGFSLAMNEPELADR